MKKLFKNKILITIIIAALFGLAGGVGGFLYSRAYMYKTIFNIPFISDIDFSKQNGNSGNVIISSAEKVVVEQNTKVSDTINMSKKGIVGIYKKIDTNSTSTLTKTPVSLNNIDQYYNTTNFLGQGFIITSDGWIITNYILEDINKINIPKNYVAITAEKEIYDVDKINFDKTTGFSFWHINAKNLPINKLIMPADISLGEIVVASNWPGDALVSNVMSKATSGPLVKSSDLYLGKLFLNQSFSSIFNNSFIFNLSGDLVGVIDHQGEILTLNNFTSPLVSIFSNKKIERAVLGVNYINVADLYTPKGSFFQNGALIYKNEKGIAVIPKSPAQIAGLEENDLILSVNNIEITKENDLNEIISQFNAGDKVKIKYIRKNKEAEVDIKLGSQT